MEHYRSKVEQGLVSAGMSSPAKDEAIGVGILIADRSQRELVEGAARQLELRFVSLEEGSLTLESIISYEIIVADGEPAHRIWTELAKRKERGEGVNPAVIRVVAKLPEGVAPADDACDGALLLPQEPELVAAQLSLLLYAHRAFARRYRTALEELYLNRRIFRSVTSGISVANAREPDMPLVYVNPAFEVMTGYCLDEVQGKNCRFLQRGESAQAGVTLIREAIREQREVTAVLKNYRKDGTAFWNELSLSPIRNWEGELTHFVGIQTDVTARMEFEAALRQSEKLAAVGRLASSIAHEINNPLESVVNLVYLAQHSAGPADATEYLKQADKELQRMKLIMSHSLRFYKQSTKPQAVHTAELLRSVLELHQARLENSGVTVEHREREMPAVVCLESELRQVLNNLVSNAIDAMHGRGGRLVVRSREGKEWRYGVPGVVITVADTGGGMSPETMESMYRAFFTTKGIQATGLGLWISSEIVERHQGRLRVRSRPGSGTVVELFLPFAGVSPAREERPADRAMVAAG